MVHDPGNYERDDTPSQVEVSISHVPEFFRHLRDLGQVLCDLAQRLNNGRVPRSGAQR